MKKLIMIVLPPALAFWLMDLVIKYYLPYKYPVQGIATIGDGTPYGLITFFKSFMPFLFVIALLTQATFGLLIWKRIVAYPQTAFMRLLGLALLCGTLALGLSYIIWDKTAGVGKFVHFSWFMAVVQIGYWVVVFGLLWLIDRPKRLPAQPVAETATENSDSP